MTRLARFAAIAFALLLAASPAAAQWTRILDVPETDVFSVWANGDTIAAGTDSAAYVSTDAGATWKSSVRVAPGVISVQGVAVRNGRLYAGTYGQGVFVSDDLGDTWVAFNQGLAGGIFDSHLFVTDLLVNGDSIYVATGGAGVYIRNLLSGNWSHYGEQFEPNQSSNLNDIAAGGTRLLASGGANGTVFHRDPGDPDWTLSWLDNVGIVPGLAALSATWTGSGWVVGSNIGVFTSPTGQEPWTFVDLGLGTLFTAVVARRGGELLAAFGAGPETTIGHSTDGGATWQFLETLFPVFIYNIAIRGDDLYAGRGDGLWRRFTPTVSVPRAEPPRLRFAITGAQPVRDVVRFRFALPEAGHAVIEIFDVSGRRVGDRIEGAWPAGSHEAAWDAGRLVPGVYTARFSAQGRHEAARLVRVR